jgi:outer membrane receptor for monomeric catechols
MRVFVITCKGGQKGSVVLYLETKNGRVYIDYTLSSNPPPVFPLPPIPPDTTPSTTDRHPESQ